MIIEKFWKVRSILSREYCVKYSEKCYKFGQSIYKQNYNFSWLSRTKFFEPKSSIWDAQERTSCGRPASRDA